MDQAKPLGDIKLVNSNSSAGLVAYSDGFKMENGSVMSPEAENGEVPQKESVPSLLDIVVERPPVHISKKKGKSRTKKKKSKVKLQKISDADNCCKYKLFVTKLTKKVTPQNLKDYFGKYGSIAEVTILNKNNISAFVKFSKVVFSAELFENTHLINDTTVEIHPNVHLKNEYRRSMKEKN